MIKDTKKIMSLSLTNVFISKYLKETVKTNKMLFKTQVLHVAVRTKKDVLIYCTAAPPSITRQIAGHSQVISAERPAVKQHKLPIKSTVEKKGNQQVEYSE
jgi:hypothetical protein